MPWTIDRPPASMAHLSRSARDKAVHVANALLAQGCDEGKAIRIAIATAKKWAARFGLAAGAGRDAAEQERR